MKILISTFFMLVLVISFQNCGESFEIKEGLQFKSIAPPPPVDPIPVLKAPAVVMSVGINIPLDSTLLATDADTEQDDIRYEIVDRPVNGMLQLKPREPGQLQNFQYVPNTDFIGLDSFSFKAIDESGNESQVANYNVNVLAKGIGKLIGSWNHNACVSGTAPISINVQMAKNNFNKTGTIYSDDCTMELLKFTESGYHKIGREGVALASGQVATEYDITSSRRILEPVSEGAATILNSNAYCGYTDWKASTPKNISTTGCNGLWASESLYMYIKVDYSNLNAIKMWMADINSGENGTSVNRRTKGLLSYYLIKQ